MKSTSVLATLEITNVLTEVKAERLRQINEEGWSPDYDDQQSNGQISAAAGCYALEDSSADIDSKFPRRELPDGVPKAWPWLSNWWKPTTRRRNLIKAAALIVAEIERLDRARKAKRL